MKNEEGYIRSKAGGRMPFRVPDGYFDSFTSMMMDKLPSQEEAKVVPMRRRRMTVSRTIVSAAACFCIAVFGLTLYYGKSLSEKRPQPSEMIVSSYHKSTADTYEDEVVDYAMMDNMDIYAYLASE